MENQSQNSAVAVDKPADYLRDPYSFFAERRKESGVFQGTVIDLSNAPVELQPDKMCTALSYDAVNTVLRDGQVFSSKFYELLVPLFGPILVAMDGDRHRAHRNLVSAAFKSKSLPRWESTIVRPVCNALIDRFIDAGEADLVEDFTIKFPTMTIAGLLGLPDEDLDKFSRYAYDLPRFHSDFARAFEASEALKNYFLEQMELRKSAPTEDIIGDLVTAEIDGAKLSDEHIYSFLRLLMTAGLETTEQSSGNMLYLLLTHPDQLEAVRADRDLMPQAIEEALRYETPLTTVFRTVTEDTQLQGVEIAAGTTVDVCVGSANRDETRWERADQFDIFRDRVPHISFGSGEHTCIGLHLARMESRVALECLLDRITNIRLLTDDDPHIHGQPYRGPTSLRVTFDAVE